MNNILLENYIKSFLEQNKINELHVFDFDMTLYNHDKESWVNMSLVDFDQCYFKPAYRKENTPDYKSHVILDEVCANNNILTVKFWDDREDTLQKTGTDLKSHNQNIQYIPVKC